MKRRENCGVVGGVTTQKRMSGGGLQTGGDFGMTGSLTGFPFISCCVFLCLAWSTAACDSGERGHFMCRWGPPRLALFSLHGKIAMAR